MPQHDLFPTHDGFIKAKILDDFRPTGLLRWSKEGKLQQEHQCWITGAKDWRDIPTEERSNDQSETTE